MSEERGAPPDPHAGSPPPPPTPVPGPVRVPPAPGPSWPAACPGPPAPCPCVPPSSPLMPPFVRPLPSVPLPGPWLLLPARLNPAFCRPGRCWGPRRSLRALPVPSARCRSLRFGTSGFWGKNCVVEENARVSGFSSSADAEPLPGVQPDRQRRGTGSDSFSLIMLFLSDLLLVVTILGILAGCFRNQSLPVLSGL